MDQDELYDSLEDEFSSASSTSVVLFKSNLTTEVKTDDFIKKNPSTDYRSEEKKESTNRSDPESINQNSVSNLESIFELNLNIETDHSKDLSSIVPLYGGDQLKTDVESFKKSVSSSCMLTNGKYDLEDQGKNNRHKRRSIFTTNENSQNSCSNLESLVKNKVSKSYLDMFHARIGYPSGFGKKEIEDSVRCLFGDSEISCISDRTTTRDIFKDADDNMSDTSSFYYKQIEIDSEFHKNLNEIPNTPTVLTTPQSNLESVSEVNIAHVSEKALRKSKTRLNKTIVETFPILGGLGPNTHGIQDKLERRKKQLIYGQKASNRNRIKMMEIKVLKNLKDEIQKSNE